MAVKIPLLVGVAVGATSLLTWGGFEAHKNQEYNKKMWEYEEWRGKFFSKKDKSIKDQICNFQRDCTKYKGYFPTPYENQLWQRAYKNLMSNSNDKKRLPDVNSSEDLKDYCYGEIKKDNDGKGDFNPSGSTLHDLCVLSGSQLEK